MRGRRLAWMSALAGAVSVSIDELRAGVMCRHAIEDDHGVLLLGENTQITQQFIDGLRDRGVSAIEIDPRDLAAMRGNKKKKPPPRREPRTESDWVKSKPLKNFLVDRFDEPLSEERSEVLREKMDSAKRQFGRLVKRIERGRLRSLGDLIFVSDDYARSIVDDHDQTLGSILQVDSETGPDEVSIRMAVLGIAIATEMGLDAFQALEVGMAGLLHDIGLHTMDPKFRKPVDQMTEAEVWEYRKHPLVSVLCVSEVTELPESVRIAIQQVHEQYDGSGYPRGIKGIRIHAYARILNVVDAYLRLTVPSAERPGVVPHDALGLMLHQASRGFFDPQVIRALLNVESLFPLGSKVELRSGEAAQVIRRPRNGFAAPVLQDSDGNRIETESGEVEIVRPICEPASEQVRLSKSVMQSTLWHPASHTLPT